MEELGMIKDIKINFWLMAKCPKSPRIGPKLGKELAGNGVCAERVSAPGISDVPGRKGRHRSFWLENWE